MIDLLIGFINKNFTLTTSLHCGFSLMLLEIIKKAIILHVKALIFVSFNFAAAAVVIVFFPSYLSYKHLLTRQGLCEWVKRITLSRWAGCWLHTCAKSKVHMLLISPKKFRKGWEVGLSCMYSLCIGFFCSSLSKTSEVRAGRESHEGMEWPQGSRLLAYIDWKQWLQNHGIR